MPNMLGDDTEESTNTTSRLLIRHVFLPGGSERDERTFYDVLCLDGKVQSIRPTEGNQYVDEAEFSQSGGTLLQTDGLLLPGLCHAHIHLDKCFLLREYPDLQISTGDFKEALSVTDIAKSRFSQDELTVLRRGHELIRRSVECGVTSMRAHVEVDKTVNNTCVDVGLRLREQFKDQCDVQIAVFAQDPLFQPGSDQAGENYRLLAQAATLQGVQAIGSAPYVEPDIACAKRNINLVLDLASKYHLFADFHLDYNFDPSLEPLIWYLLEELTTRINNGSWSSKSRVCVGHATRLALFTPNDWNRYKRTVEEASLPITLVGLPQSDLYMMGRGTNPAPRTTLNVTRLTKEHNIQIAMSVNNVQNAFTPQGSVDPLSLCPLGAAVFQSATRTDCDILLKSVTTTARQAIGIISASETADLIPRVGDPADFVLLHDNTSTHLAALNPSYDRTTIKDGRIVSIRKTEYLDEDMYRNTQSR